MVSVETTRRFSKTTRGISVASHMFGTEIRAMIRNFKTGDIKSALNMHKKLYPIMKKLFMAPNPVPVKAALAHFGIIEDYVRRPLVELTADEKEELYSVIEKYDIAFNPVR